MGIQFDKHVKWGETSDARNMFVKVLFRDFIFECFEVESIVKMSVNFVLWQWPCSCL